MILSTSLIFLVIVIIRKVFREKVGNVFLYSLWLLFAAGLTVPLFSFALLNLAGWNKGTMKSSVSIMNFIKQPDSNAEEIPSFINQQKNIADKGKVNKEKALMESDEITTEKTMNAKNEEAVLEAKETTQLHAWIKLCLSRKVLYIFWTAGTVAVLLRQVFLEKAFRRQIIENREEVIFQGQKVYKTKGIKTPLLFRSSGWVLDIYLPETIMDKEILVKHAILHEQTHKRHGDVWWGYIRNILLAIYWFYPLAWIAAALSKSDGEYACDSSVIKDMSQKERISYGNSLLYLIQIDENRDWFCTATAMKIRKSEMEVRIRMIKKERKRNILTTIFVLGVICATATSAFTDAVEPKREPEEKIVNEQPSVSKPPEHEKELSVKETEITITDMWGADIPQIYYEDKKRMIFAGYFGLFVYSREKGEIVQSLDLKEIGCDATQGDHYCEINVSEDGNTVYLHVASEKKMYRYSVDTKELQYLDYQLPKELYDRKQWAKNHKSGIKCNGGTIGDLVYWYSSKGMGIQYEPLFYKPYGTCQYIQPKEIKELCEVSFYANGQEYVITDRKKLCWIEEHFSEPIEVLKGGSACPFYHVMYLKRKDGVCGKVFPATDNDAVYQSDNIYYTYANKFNDAFWKLFGIKDISEIR